MIKNRLTLLLLAFFVSQLGYAQVSGLSYTLAPSGEHVWWNDNAGLEDGYLIGGKLGFGFGEFFEMRASYQQGYELKNNFEDFGLASFDANTFTQRDVNLTRWGGEMRANIGRKKLMPFVLLGTGVQKLELDSKAESQQIYLTAGAGINIGLADRFTLVLEARNTAYRFNSGVHLLTDADKIGLGVTNSDFNREDLTNWSLGAALQFYLGGRKPGKMSELDKAYFNSFSGSSGGLDLGLEAVIGKMNFDNSLLFRDTWMAGASAGFDLGPYIGLRAHYWRALDEDSFTSLDDLAMWGGEIRMRMNTSGGMVPFLMLGGGMIDVQDGYQGKTIFSPSDTLTAVLDDDSDTPYAMGGLGLIMPVSKNLKIFGSARAILTSTPPIDDLYAPEEINTSWFYSAGVKLRFGKKNKSPEEIRQLELTQKLDEQKAQNDIAAEELKIKYEEKITKLESELIKAYEEKDLEKAKVIKEEKAEAEQVVVELENRDEPIEKSEPVIVNNETMTTPQVITSPNTATPIGNVSISNSGSEIRMSPAEFQNLIEEILESVDEPIYPQDAQVMYAPAPPVYSSYPNEQYLNTEKQVVEETIIEKEEIEEEIAEDDEKEENEEELKRMLIELERKLDQQNEDLKIMNNRLESLEKSGVINQEEEKEVKRWRLFKKKNKSDD